MSFARLGRLTVLLLSLNLAQPFAALAQTNTSAPLPPAAQEALTKGIIAAKLPDYPLAIRYFEEARKIAPDAPVIFLNLGLAESKIPGRELRAMAWFGAYLAAYPDAPNVAAVKEQVAVLDVKFESDFSHLIQTAQDDAKQSDDLNAFCEVVSVWVKAGNLEAAFRFAESAGDSWRRDIMQAQIASEQREAGDIAGAQKTAEGIQDLSVKASAQQAISVAQAKAGDIAGAQKTAESIQDTEKKAYAQRAIAEAQTEAGDIVGAQKIAEGIQDIKIKAWAQEAIAKAQAKAGDIAGAQKTAEEQRAVAVPQAKINTTANPPTPEFTTWLKILDDKNQLNQAIFLDMGAHLKSLSSDSPLGFVTKLCDTARKIAGAHQVITQMLKQQAQPPAKP